MFEWNTGIRKAKGDIFFGINTMAGRAGREASLFESKNVLKSGKKKGDQGVTKKGSGGGFF